jgi:Mycobacterium membrane protein
MVGLEMNDQERGWHDAGLGDGSKGMSAVDEPGVRGVLEVRSDVAIAGGQDPSQPGRRRLFHQRPARQTSPAVRAQGGRSSGRRNPGLGILRTLARLWIPLVIVLVIGVGGLTVSRLHGLFGAGENRSSAGTKVDAAKPFNPKHLRYEVFGPPGTVAVISYFDGNGDPQHADGVTLPWSLEFAISTAASIGSISAQGDSDNIGCRITVDGAVKDEKISNEVSAFASCRLKGA